jgi:excisionase family DNA binding protein
MPLAQTIDRMLSPGEVAVLFRVSPKTVTRWAKQGKVHAIRTPGGHRRYRESEVRALLDHAGTTPPAPVQRRPTDHPTE